MPIFALAAFVVAVIAIIYGGIGVDDFLWFYLAFLALHLAFGGVAFPAWRRDG